MAARPEVERFDRHCSLNCSVPFHSKSAFVVARVVLGRRPV